MPRINAQESDVEAGDESKGNMLIRFHKDYPQDQAKRAAAYAEFRKSLITAKAPRASMELKLIARRGEGGGASLLFHEETKSFVTLSDATVRDLFGETPSYWKATCGERASKSAILKAIAANPKGIPVVNIVASSREPFAVVQAVLTAFAGAGFIEVNSADPFNVKVTLTDKGKAESEK